jgi:hypothetical protein
MDRALHAPLELVEIECSGCHGTPLEIPHAISVALFG